MSHYKANPAPGFVQRYAEAVLVPTKNPGQQSTLMPSLDLPPPYRAVMLRERGDAVAHAQSIATRDGAGTLVWVRRFDTVEFAVVLEPEEPLVRARCALYAAMNAAADALAIHCPPERPLAFAWPDTILLDGGILGGARLSWPENALETAPPDWLVIGLVLRMTVPHARPANRGAHALDQAVSRGTSLEIEGFEMMDGAALIGGFARHFMLQIDRWQEKGFRGIGEEFLARLTEEKAIRRGIDVNGDLLTRRSSAGGTVQRQLLSAALAKPQWLDPETGDPWL